MKSIKLNFSKCQSISDIYQEIKTKFKLPQNCGENLSALWDSLDCYCDYELRVTVVGIEDLSEEIQNYIRQIKQIFTRVSRENQNITFEYK